MTPLTLEGISPTRWCGTLMMYFVTAALLALFLTPLLRHAAHRLGIVDLPDENLKGHDGPVAYMGGLALFLSFVMALAPVMPYLGKELEALLMGAGFLVLLGLVDDLHPLSPGVKFLGQMLPAGLVVKAGLLLELPLPEGTPAFVPICITLLWVLGITNAFNIIDVMDGLSAGVGLIALTSLLMVTLMNGTSPVTALATISLAGALLGFLHFNSRPASIFLGDAGSLLLGFLLGGLVLTTSFTDLNPLGFAAPALLLGLPIFDTGFVMALRFRAGLPVYRGSPDHFAVRLRQAGFSVRKIVIWSYAVSAVLGATAIWLLFLSRPGSVRLLGAITCVCLTAGLLLARLGTRGRAKQTEPCSATPNRAPSSSGSPNGIRTRV